MTKDDLADALPEGSRAFLDEAAVRAYLGEAGSVGDVAAFLVDGLVQPGRVTALVSAMTALRILAAAAAAGDPLLPDRVADFLAYCPHLTVCAVDLDVAMVAADLGGAGRLSQSDALLVAGAIAAGASVLLTADPGLRARLGDPSPLPVLCLADYADTPRARAAGGA